MDEGRSRILKYGQVIRLQGDFGPKFKGMVCSKGYTDASVYCEVYKNISSINNYREGLFQILPRGSFEIHDEYIKLHSSDKKYESLRQRLKTEQDQYFEMIQSKMNEDVLFGSEVYFKHIESESYLMCSDKCSDFRTDCFKLELSNQLGVSMIFKILPYHSYQQDGQCIHFDEPLKIQSEGFWLDSIKDQQVFIDETIEYDRQNIGLDLRPSMRRLSQNARRYEVVISHNGRDSWNFKFHEGWEQHEKNRLKPYDLCYFVFTKNNSHLSVDMFKNQLLLRENKDSSDAYVGLESVWELQPELKIDDQGGPPRSSLFYQSDKKPPSGFVLRHFLSGKVLTASDKDEDYLSCSIEAYSNRAQSQIFQLEAAKVGQIQLQHGQFVKVMHEDSELQQIAGESPKPNCERSQSNGVFKRLQEEDLDYKTHDVGFLQIQSADAFQMHRLADESKRDLLFVLSSQEWLVQFVDTLKLSPMQVEQRLTSKILNKIIMIVKQLIGFVLNIGEKEDVEESEALPMARRQRTLKDLYIIELLIEIFYFISYKNGLESLFRHRKTEKEKIKQIFKLSYCLIGKIIKGNPQIKLHVSQWLELFLHQAMMIDDNNVQQSLTELLDDNYYAIQNFISKSSITRIVDLMRSQQPHEKYLKILSSICVCKGKSVFNNQIHCLNLFFQQNESQFHFKKQQGQLLVMSKAHPQCRTFQQFYKESSETDSLQSWNYFIAYFNLLSDVCINRNKQAKQFVDDLFPLNILCDIVEEYMSEPFLKLIHFAYIDCSNYPTIKKIIRVHEWNHLSECVNIQRTQSEQQFKPENCDVKRVMQILQQILNNFRQLSVKDRTYSQNLYTVLQVLRSTIQLGFWESITDLQELLQNLLRVCSCLNEFSDITYIDIEDGSTSSGALESRGGMMMSSQKHKLTEYYQQQMFQRNKMRLTRLTLENQIIMQCKMLACDIIALIFDIEANVRVTKLAYVFKKIHDECVTANPTKKQYKNTPNLLRDVLDATRSSSALLDDEIKVYTYMYTQQSTPTLKSMAIQFKKGFSDQEKSFYDVQRWIDEIKTLINERNLLDNQKEQSLELILAEISLYEVAEMPTFALSILKRYYGQRKELMINFEKLLLVADGQSHQLAQETKIITIRFQNITNMNNMSGLIEDLIYLSQSLKKDVYKISNNHQPKCDDGIILPYNEREINNRLHQSLLMALDFHVPLLQFIEQPGHEQSDMLHHCYMLLTLLIWNHSDNKFDLMKFKNTMYNHLHLNVGVIDFLRELFTNNKPLIFSEREIPIVLSHVISACDKIPNSMYYKSKLLDFLRVLLIYNSKSIRINQLLTLQSLQDDKYSNLMIKLNVEEPWHSKSTSYYVDLQSFMEDNVSINLVDSLYDEMQFEKWIDYYQQQYVVGMEETINLGPQLTYLYTYFQIFSLLVEDQNDINIEKCRQMHPFNALVKMLSRSKQCWPLKRHLRAYINRLYYRQMDYENISQQFIDIDIYNILQDMSEVIEIKSEVQMSHIQRIRISNPVRFQFLISYVYLSLEECLITLNMVLNNEAFLSDLEDVLTHNYKNGILQTHLQLFEIATKLSQLQYFYHTKKFVSHLCQELMSIFKLIFRTFDMQLLLIREGLFNSALEMTSVTESITIVHSKMEGNCMIEGTTEIIERGSGPSDVISQGRDLLPADISLEDLKIRLIENVFNLSNEMQKKRRIQSDVLKMFHGKKLDQQEEINELINHRHKRLIQILSLSTQFQQFLDEEFIKVCEQLLNIGRESMRVYGRSFEVTTPKEFIQNIIQMCITNPGFLIDDLRVFFLKILGRLISKVKNKDTMLPVDQWTSDYWCMSKREIEQAQDFLNECGAAELIYQTFLEPQLELRLDLTSECLTFAIAFLLGGNTKSQNSLLNRLKQDNGNVALQNFAVIIRKISRVVYNNFSIGVESVGGMRVQTVDNFDYYDGEVMKRFNVVEPDDAKESAFKKQCLDLLCKFYRVLQLMCENNNVDMKRFIRQQTDVDEQVKLNSINFIEFTTTQLRLFMKILSKAVIAIPSFMMDFLIEIIQLPCVENQITLCQTTFFEDASYMSQYFAVPENRLQRAFETAEQLQELQNKILVAVLSVLEGNENKIYQDLQNKLEISFLLHFLKSNLDVLGVTTVVDMERLLESQSKTFQDQIIRVMNVSVIIKKIGERHPTSKWLRHLYDAMKQEHLYEIMEMLGGRIRNIEIVYEGKSMVVFYPSHPLFDCLSAHTTKHILFTVKRDSQREKILSLLECKEILFFELEYNHKLNQMRFAITQRKIDLLYKISSGVSILINLVMALSFQVLVEEGVPSYHANQIELNLIRILSLIQLVCQVMLLVMYAINRAPITLRKNEKKYHNRKKWEVNYMVQMIHDCLIVVKGEEDFLILFLMVALSLLGVFQRTYFFVIHLFEIFSRLSLLKNVFQAISYNAKQLLVVALLGVLFVYSFSVIGFKTYFGDIYPTLSEEVEICTSLVSCMITLITSGVINNSMTQWDPMKFVFDMFYIVFFGLLFTNIISGIMIDTFAELRDQRYKVEDDMKNFCFICGIGRSTLEKHNISFEEHTQRQHNIWNYIFYIYCLQQKDSTEYTGLEYWLSEKIEKDDIQWFPNINDDVDDVHQQLKDIKAQLLAISSQFTQQISY